MQFAVKQFFFSHLVLPCIKKIFKKYRKIETIVELLCEWQAINTIPVVTVCAIHIPAINERNGREIAKNK